MSQPSGLSFTLCSIVPGAASQIAVMRLRHSDKWQCDIWQEYEIRVRWTDMINIIIFYLSVTSRRIQIVLSCLIFWWHGVHDYCLSYYIAKSRYNSNEMLWLLHLFETDMFDLIYCKWQITVWTFRNSLETFIGVLEDKMSKTEKHLIGQI